MLVEKKLVEVELDVVELSAVKFWRVVEPVTRRSARVVVPLMFSVEKLPAPEAETIQVPVIAKQPLAKSIPLVKVEVALAVTESVPVCIPPAKVEVEKLVTTRALEVVVAKLPVPVTTILPPSLVLPTTSKMLPVVVVAVAPIIRTSEVSFCMIARLSVVVENGLEPEPPPEVRSVPQDGMPADTLSTVPAPPIGSLERVPAPLAYNISPVT